MPADRLLHAYWRSSASYRVRAALNLKQLEYVLRPVHLLHDGGQQHAAAFRQLNPQQLIPLLEDGGQVITQSLAIIEYLDETYPDTLPLLPRAPRARAWVRELALAVACDIHPLGNLRVLQYLHAQYAADDARTAAWSRHWIATGLAAIEAMLVASPARGRFCLGDAPGLADCCLVPQVYNARRFGVDLEALPSITRIEAACLQLDAFRRALPEAQPDAPAT